MRRKLARAVVTSLCLLALVGGSGCYGKNIVTTSVVKWHHGIQSDKYVKEAIYLPLFFFVLPITAFVDNFILNSIDFWTKEDPLSAAMIPEPSPDRAVAVTDVPDDEEGKVVPTEIANHLAP